MTHSNTLSLGGIAYKTGLSYDWLARKANRKRLYARGFPRPLNVPGRPRWNTQAVEQWIGGAPLQGSAQQATQGRKSGRTAEIISIEAGKRKLMDALAS